MNDISGFVENIADQLGRTFLFTGFLPMIILVTVNQYLFFAPPITGAVFNLFSTVPADSPLLGVFSGEMVTSFVLALVLGFLIIPLNLFVIRLFEGLWPGGKIVLSPFYMLISATYRKLYAPIAAKRAERRAMLEGVESEEKEYNPDTDYSIQDSLHELHSQRETQHPAPLLPFEARRLMPTSFGNAWAVIEEYPQARYGIDSMVFWPYLRVVMRKEDSSQLEAIDGQKMLIDIVIHLALVMGILTVEGIVFGLMAGQSVHFIAAAVCAFLFVAFYQAGVNYTRTMGGMISQSFDLYRLNVLDAFGLTRPQSLDEEYWTWVRLAAFIRRGEPFYYDLLDRVGQSDGEEDR